MGIGLELGFKVSVCSLELGLGLVSITCTDGEWN